MKQQQTIYLDSDVLTRLQSLKRTGKYDSVNQTIEHAIEKGLEALRAEYRENKHTLPSKPKSRRDPCGKHAWTQEYIDMFGE
jgi:hypothetical protein